MALVPPAVITVTSTVPVPGAVVAVIEVALVTVNDAAAKPPKLTFVTPVKFVPVMVTLVPPAPEPVLGLTPATVGADT